MKIIETNFYISRLSKVIHKGQDEALVRNNIKNFLVDNVLQGDIIPGTGGLRKIRFSTQDKGKRGGYRIIYYFYNEHNPLHLLTIYAKSSADDMSVEEKKAFSGLIKQLKEIYKGGKP